MRRSYPDGDQALKEVQVLNVNNPHEVDAYIRYAGSYLPYK